MSKPKKTEFEKWIDDLSHKPTIIPNPSKFYAHVAASPLAMASSGNPIVSNSKLVGPNASQIMAADTAYSNARASGNMDEAQSTLASNPATGCAMVLNLAQKGSGFNPSSPTQIDNMTGFNNYVGELFKCPVLQNQLNDSPSVNYQSDWNSTVAAISNYYVGIDPSELATIRDSLYSIARAAASMPNTNQSQNLFVQNTINTDGNIKVYMYKSYIQMERKVWKGSGKNAPTYSQDNTSFKIYRVVFEFLTENWPAYSRIIMPKTNASISSWLNDNSPAQNAQPVNWDS